MQIEHISIEVQDVKRRGAKRCLNINSRFIFTKHVFLFCYKNMPGSLRTTLITVAGLSGIGSAGGYYYFKTTDKESQLVVPVKEAYVPKHYDRRPFQLLSKEEIDKRLRSGQFANQIQVNYVKAVYTNQLPSNNPVEDTFSINTFQQGLIAGVYDGKQNQKSKIPLTKLAITF